MQYIQPWYIHRASPTSSEAKRCDRPPLLMEFHRGLVILEIMHYDVPILQPNPHNIHSGGLGQYLDTRPPAFEGVH